MFSEVRWLRKEKRPQRVGEKIALECSSRGGAGGGSSGGLLRPWPNITWYIGGKRVSISRNRHFVLCLYSTNFIKIQGRSQEAKSFVKWKKQEVPFKVRS